MKARYGFVSFTEVEAGAHQSYNRWHLFDHLPEQLPVPGIVWGQRWVLTPEERARSVAVAPLDRIHYVTLYLQADPIAQTLDDFFALARRLRDLDRFHEQRTSHLSGVMVVAGTHSADPLVLSAEAVPYRPHRAVHVRVSPRRGQDDDTIETHVEAPGAVGTWTFAGDPTLSPPALHGLTATWTWLDPSTAAAVAPTRPDALFDATLATVDPWGAWDWFDAG